MKRGPGASVSHVRTGRRIRESSRAIAKQKEGLGSLAQADGPKTVRINPGNERRRSVHKQRFLKRNATVYASYILPWLVPYTQGPMGMS